MCVLHEWGKWREANYNKYPYVLPKKEERECEKCHKIERRDLPSLEKRIFNYHKEGGNIEIVLEKLMSDYGLMRYQYITKTLVKEAIEGRK